jgi:16S rRNA (guanine527-N7)-methyltransferase
VVDLGSGAGLPGIPLAIARPDLRVVLLEPMQRRVRFLQHCLETLGLAGVTVHHGRAEAGLPELADVVVARAVTGLDGLMGLAFGLLIDNGTLLALKGREARREIDEVTTTTSAQIDLLTLAAPGEPATVIRVARPPRARDQRTGRSRKVSR